MSFEDLGARKARAYARVSLLSSAGKDEEYKAWSDGERVKGQRITDCTKKPVEKRISSNI